MADFEAIIKRHRPRGWRVVYSRRKDKVADAARIKLQKKHVPSMTNANSEIMAQCHPQTKVIHAPHVVDAMTLHALLHEFGHVKLDHWGKGQSSEHREEFEAERWAAEIMRIEGVPVPTYLKRGMKRYVRHCIERDVENGIDIQPHVRKYAKDSK